MVGHLDKGVSSKRVLFGSYHLFETLDQILLAWREF